MRRTATTNLLRYQLFCLFCFTPFMQPVIVIFWRENGLDLVDIHLLQAVFAVAVVLLEVPTGMLADRVGKRASLLAGTATFCLGMLIYALGQRFGTFLAAELILALGLSLYSGAGSALLFDSLEALDRTKAYTRYEGRARALQMVSFALCNLVGGLVGSISTRTAVWLTGVGPLVALMIGAGLVEIKPPTAVGPWTESMRGYGRLTREALRFVRRHRLVRWKMVFFAVLNASSLWLFWLYQPYMERCGLPLWSFGALFAGFNLFAAVCSHFAHRIDTRFGRQGTLWLLGLLQLAPPLLMAERIGIASVALILGHQAARGLALPVFSGRLLRYAYANKRATVLSIASMGGRLLYGASAPFFGWIAQHGSLEAGLRAQAVALFVLFGGLLLTYRQIPRKYFTVKPAVSTHQ
jgi:MFS family permease